MNITIREKSQGLIVWNGDYPSVEAAISAYRSDLGAEAFDYDAVDPDWINDLEISTRG